jgi:hypothetical protein
MSIESLGIAASAAVGIGGFVIAILGHYKNEMLRRKENIFRLITDFNNDKKILIAKAILDDYSFRKDMLYNIFIESSQENKSEKFLQGELLMESVENNENYVNEYQLKHILRNHRNNEVREQYEIIIRTSFDTFLDFFVKLEYLLSIGLIKKQEIDYFNYYIEKAAKNDAVKNYVMIYKFPLKGKLHSDLDVSRITNK